MKAIFELEYPKQRNSGSSRTGAKRGGGGGAQFPGRRKVPPMSQSTFFNVVHLLPKDLRFEHGGAKLASCLERHTTSLRPCSHIRTRRAPPTSALENEKAFIRGAVPSYSGASRSWQAGIFFAETFRSFVP